MDRDPTPTVGDQELPRQADIPVVLHQLGHNSPPIKPAKMDVYLPNEGNHAHYQQLYENVYLALQPHLLTGYGRFPLDMNYIHTKVKINDHK